MRVGITAIIATVAALQVPPARSDETEETERTESETAEAGARDKTAEAAVEAFKQGTYHFGRGEFVLAAEAFRRADELRPNWKILYNLAQSEAAAKRYGLALEAFEAYLVRGGDEVPPDRKDAVLAEVEQMRELVGILDIAAPEGAEVFVDDVLRGRAPLSGPLLVAAGIEHRVTVKEGDAVVAERPVKLSGGMQRKLDMTGSSNDEKEVEPIEDDGDEPAVAPVEQKPGGMFIAGVSLLGVGGATLLGGVVTGALALSKDSELDPICADNGCPPDRAGDRDTLNNLALSTNVLLGVGGTFAVAGVVLTVLGRKRGGAAERVSLQPLVSPEFAGGSLTWRF